MAPVNDETYNKLAQLHPEESFVFLSPNLKDSYDYWSHHPVRPKELYDALKSRKSGSAPGPSGLSYDHLKLAFEFSYTLVDDCCSYYKKVLTGKVVLPEALTASKLVALSKSNGGVRPIAVSESLTRLLAVVVFNRCKFSSINYLKDFQWGIGVVDGAACAVHAVETLLSNDSTRSALLLDFSNAFNSVKRSSISNSIINSPLVSLLSYFQAQYSTKSKLLFHSYSVMSSSGVKQGDPLGPLLFCLAIYEVILNFKEIFPDIEVLGYMDDLTLLGRPEDLKAALPVFASIAAEVGLMLNAKKCLFVCQEDVEAPILNNIDIPKVDFRNDALRLLGAYIGFNEKVKELLDSLLDSFENELNTVTNFNISKQLKFTFLRCCYSSKFNHIFRSGIGLTKANVLVKSAFLGGLRNFLFEFKLRFPNEDIENSSAPFLLEGKKLVDSLPEDTWARLFSFTSEVKEKKMSNLVFTFKELQNKLKIIYESDTFKKNLSLAKTKDVNLYNLLIELSSQSSTPSSSLLLSTIPRKYGLNLDDDAFVACLRLRLNLHPGIILVDSLCLCGKPASFDHVVCCSHFNWTRSLLHDNMINELHQTCKSVGVVSSTEPLLSNLYNKKSSWTSKSRGDLHLEWLNSKQLIVDATTVYFRSKSNLKKICTDANEILYLSEQCKIKKYKTIMNDLNCNRQIKVDFIALAVSLCGRLSNVGEQFFVDFQSMIRSRGRKYFCVHLHKIKFIFALFNRFCSFLRKISMKLSVTTDKSHDSF
ncbi:hypothetical protein RCL1_007165 [Eukaryota sp. TZLM3-RCL]